MDRPGRFAAEARASRSAGGNLLLGGACEPRGMKRLPRGWHVHRGKSDRHPERALLELRGRLSAVTRRFERSLRRRRVWRRASAAGFAAALGVIAVSVPYILVKVLSPWPAGTTIRHIAAAPNCTAARLVGLAPAARGQPGYWPGHDADRDGLACEPVPRWR